MLGLSLLFGLVGLAAVASPARQALWAATRRLAPEEPTTSFGWGVTPDALLLYLSLDVNGVFGSVFGIAATGEYRAFCQGVAADNNGNYIDVP